jgi:outer membrane lipoprotein SlyB
MQIPAKPGLHPMLWVAAIAITLFSLVGLAALTGFIGKTPQPEEIAALAPPQEAAPPASVDAPPSVPPAVPAREEAAPAAEAPAKPAVKPKPRPAARPASAEPVGSAPPMESAGTRVALCASCGVVESVRSVQAQGEGSGIGAIAGGVLGGALGHQVGKGSGNTLATIAGAVAGGYAGHQVEKNVRTSTQYEITVHMDDGGRRVLTRKEAPQWRQGDRVEVGPDGELSAAPPASSSRSSF